MTEDSRIQRQLQKVRLHDVTLRDGNHAVGHQITTAQAVEYAKKAKEAGITRLEVGHGNGLGGSSVLVGLSLEDDVRIVEEIRKAVPDMEIAVHVIPSFASVNLHLIPAIEAGVGFARVAAHCTEADTTEAHIKFFRSHGLEVGGALMMASRLNAEGLVRSAELMEGFGATEVVFMDSTGSMGPTMVSELISTACSRLSIPVGFHAHDNFGLANGNSVAAIHSGARFVDASILGLGAGAGNAKIEQLVSLGSREGYDFSLNNNAVLRLALFASESLKFESTVSSPQDVAIAKADLFSGFRSLVSKMAREFDLDFFELAEALAKESLVAGQEDRVRTIAHKMLEVKKR